MMKDELGDAVMREFIGVPPKRYSYLTDDNQLKKRQKLLKNVSSIREYDCLKNEVRQLQNLVHIVKNKINFFNEVSYNDEQ